MTSSIQDSFIKVNPGTLFVPKGPSYFTITLWATPEKQYPDIVSMLTTKCVEPVIFLEQQGTMVKVICGAHCGWMSVFDFVSRYVDEDCFLNQ